MEKKEEKRYPPEAGLVYEWWSKLKEDKGRRAELRRAKDLEEVFFTPAYHTLLRKLSSTKWHSSKNIALIAGILAHVENNSDKITFATQMASPGKNSKKNRVSGLRFRRLIQHKTQEDVFGPLIRIVRLLDKNANIRDLAQKLYWWNDRARKDWAFEYYSKAPSED